MVIVPALLTGCSTMTGKSSTPPLVRTVRHVELHRYMGRWFVIAAVPYALEKGKVATSDTYRELGDGTIEVTYTFREGSLDAPEQTWQGTARVVDNASKATWKVRMFWLLTAEYRIIHLHPDYRWAVATNGDGTLLWILARERHLSGREYQDIARRIQKDGFDITKLRRVPQTAGRNGT